ncbi:MAG: agmatinase [Methanosarcinales archaeon]|nr:agmatinase [Methanosarcinales archaeon]
MSGTLFADANHNYSDAAFVIFGAPFDGTSCFRKGSRQAPNAIREASYNFEKYNVHFDIDISRIPIHDMGDVEIKENNTVEQALTAVEKTVSTIIQDCKIPIMLGGEHSLTLPCVTASKNKYDDMGVVVLDAHLDLRDRYEGEVNSHACISRHIIEDVTDRYVSIGIRSGTKDEYSLAKVQDITYYPADLVVEKGIAYILNELNGKLDTQHLYLSLDMDAIDPAYAPALGTPEPFGLTDRHVLSVIHELAPRSIGFDLVEIAPQFDSGNTAILGAKFIREFIASAWAFKKQCA